MSVFGKVAAELGRAVRGAIADVLDPSRLADRERSAADLAASGGRAHNLLHRLWSRAVGQEGYNKSEWTEFASLLSTMGVQPGSPSTTEVAAITPKRTPGAFATGVAQDVAELILPGKATFAELAPAAAMERSKDLYRKRQVERPRLTKGGLRSVGVEFDVFAEVMAFVFSWLDVSLQAGPHGKGWLECRSNVYRDILHDIQTSLELAGDHVRHLDDVVVRRTAEYGIDPGGALMTLARYLEPHYGSEAMFRAGSVYAYVVAALGEFSVDDPELELSGSAA